MEADFLRQSSVMPSDCIIDFCLGFCDAEDLLAVEKCRDCGGILKSATISFGQALVPDVINRAMEVAAQADLFFAIGTSLQVYPIAGAVQAAHSGGAKIVILNAEETPFDGIADFVSREPIGTILPQLV